MARLYKRNDNVICNHLEFIVLWRRSAHRLHIFLPSSDNNLIFARYFITMKAKLLFIVSLFLLLSQTLVAQEQDTVQRKKTRIHIDHYDVATFSKSMGDMQRLIGHVKMHHDSAYFFCDSAYFYEKTNSFKAFQNVHIIVNDSVEVFSDLLLLSRRRDDLPWRQDPHQLHRLLPRRHQRVFVLRECGSPQPEISDVYGYLVL